MTLRGLYSSKSVFASLFVAVILFIAGAGLHHGWAHYDQNTTLDYTGTIQESGMENPHSYVRLNVEREGKVWLVILAPLSRMQARGVTEEMVKPGNTVRVVGYPHRKIKDEMRAERIIIGDQAVELR